MTGPVSRVNILGRLGPFATVLLALVKARMARRCSYRFADENRVAPDRSEALAMALSFLKYYLGGDVTRTRHDDGWCWRGAPFLSEPYSPTRFEILRQFEMFCLRTILLFDGVLSPFPP